MKEKILLFLYTIACFFICGYGYESSANSKQIPNYTFLNVTAQKGDHIIGLLNRYALSSSTCSISFFRKLNNLSDKDPLLPKKAYILPIRIYKYDGKSIRTTLNIDNYQTAKNIEKYNDDLLKKNIRKTNFRTDKKLWVPFDDKECTESLNLLLASNNEASINNNTKQNTNTAATTVAENNTAVEEKPYSTGASGGKFPIFGKSFEQVELKSNTLEGKIYYFVAGHGGPDPGAVGTRNKHTICEDEYAYDVTLRLARCLIEHGATVYLIVRDNNDGIRQDALLDCDKDEFHWGGSQISTEQIERLTDRCNLINTLYAQNLAKGVPQNYQRMIEIHVDSRAVGHRQDVFFYYFGGSDDGKNLASLMQNTLRKQYDKHQKGRGYFGTIEDRDLFMLRKTNPTSVYIELANITNPDDQQRLVVAKNRQLIAEWLCQGVLGEFISKKPKEKAKKGKKNN